MNFIPQRQFLASLLLTVLLIVDHSQLCSAQSEPAIVTLQTKDGLAFLFDSRHKVISGMQIMNRSLRFEPQSDRFPGVIWRNPPDSIWTTPKDAQTTWQLSIGRTSIIDTTSDQLTIDRLFDGDTKISEHWAAHKQHIQLRVEIQNLQRDKAERAYEVCMQIPMDEIGNYWHHHLDSAEIIVNNRRYHTLLTNGVDIGSSPADAGHLKSDLNINLNGINYVGSHMSGLALALDPTMPAAYDVSYDAHQQILSACFHIATQHDHVTYPDRTSFSLIFLVPDEAEWGLRSAIQKLYAIYPDHFQGTKRPRNPGMVVEGGQYEGADFPDQREYYIDAFWQLPFKPYTPSKPIDRLYYNIPSYFFDRGSLFKYVKLDSPSTGIQKAIVDQHADIYLDLLHDYERHQFDHDRDSPYQQTCSKEYFGDCIDSDRVYMYGPIRFPGDPQFYVLQPYQNVEKNYGLFFHKIYRMFDPMRISFFQNSSGTYTSAMTSITFQKRTSDETAFIRINGLNPEPGITYNSTNAYLAEPVSMKNFGQMCIENVKRGVGVYGSAYQFEIGNSGRHLPLNGVAVDVVGAYLREDYKPSMKRIATYPLSYQAQSGEVVALEHLGLAAYLSKLRAALPDTVPIAVNGLPISGFLFGTIDYIYAESGVRSNVNEACTTDKAYVTRRVNRYRMVANQRAITFAINLTCTESRPDSILQAMHRIFPQYAAKAVHLNFEKVNGANYFFDTIPTTPMDSAVVAYYKRHIQTVHDLNVAGWQAIPYARASQSNILIERFGQKYLTAYNTGPDAPVDITIDMTKIGLHPSSIPTDRDTGSPLPFSSDGTEMVVSIPALQNRQCLVIAFE